MTWSAQQEQAIKAVKRWLKDPSQQVFRLFGFAGTGKTTLAKTLAQEVKGKVLFGAFTGKAASVLRSKGCHNASTIHSMIYSVDEENETWEPKFVLNPASEVRGAKLVVIDEVSMVGEELARDLLSFGVKVLVLGDPAQLPPVKDGGYFTNEQPNIMLTEVHRQARDNPIVWMSMKVRQGERLDYGTYGESEVRPRREINVDEVLSADQILVGLNKTRRGWNDRIRTHLGRLCSAPETSDKLVCLRNSREKRLFNGGLWTVQDVLSEDAYAIKLLVSSEDSVEVKPTEVRIRHEFFTGTDDTLSWEDRKAFEEFTYGYALTVHKSQGSQWNNVIVYDESFVFKEDRARHLYTALTRAAEKVTVLA